MSSEKSIDPPLIGRDPELAEADRFVERVAAGQAGVLVITGEPGIGKTTLARHVVSQASSAGFETAWAWCWAATEAPAFWPWKQIARELGWEGTDWSDVASAFGSIAHALPASPRLIVLDDAHGADESSLSLVNLVARSFSSDPVAIVLTVCEEDVAQSSRIAHLLDDISRSGTRLDLFGLGKQPTVDLLQHLGGPNIPPLVQDAVASASRGNPFLVEQLTKETLAGRDIHRPDMSLGFNVPRGADAILERVLRRLSPESIELLSAAAVLGRMFSAELLKEVTHEAGESLTEHLLEATEKGVVERLDSLGTYAFAHALLRERLYEDMPDDRRFSLHLTAARAIEQRADPTRLGELADHYFKAGQQPDVRHAVKTIVAAAEAAEAAGSTEESTRHRYRASRLARAAGLPDPPPDIGKPTRPPGTNRAAVHADAVFRKEGEYWSVGLGGAPVLVKDSKGMGYLLSLLSTPQKEWHCLEMATPVARGERPQATDTGPVLDAHAKAQFRQRLLDIEEEIAEATEYNDDERLRKAEDEKQFILDELSVAAGLGGRDRVTGSDSERARVAVTRAIRSALRRIAAAHPALGDHLDRTIHTGTFLSYRPDPSATPAWRLQA